MSDFDDFWTLPPLAVWAPELQPHRQWLSKGERHTIRRTVRRAEQLSTPVYLGSLDVRESRAAVVEMRKRHCMSALSYRNDELGISTAWWLYP